MRKVYSNYRDVCHLWAHHSQNEAISGNVRFEGGSLFSYSTCIGERFEINGNIVFVLNNYTFSNTTSGHQSAMRSSIPGDEPNVYVFNVNYRGRGDSYITSYWHRYPGKEERLKTDIIRFASMWLSQLWNQCLEVKDNKRGDIGVDLGLFDTYKRFYEVTGVMTMKKLLRLTDQQLSEYLFYLDFDDKPDMRKIRKFIRILNGDNPTMETVVDFVAGKGVYAEYMKRTAHLHLAAKLRRMSIEIGFRTHGLGAWDNVREGCIKTAEYKKRKADGTLVSWMLEQKKLNMELKYNRKEYEDLRDRRERAKRRLMRHLGFSGWRTFGSMYGWGGKYFESFDYDGEVFSFKGCEYIGSQTLSDKEYISFRTMSKEEQRAFIHEKRMWMLSYLKEEKSRHEAFIAEYNERFRIQEEERKLRNSMLAEVEEAIKNSDYDKLRDMWYKGLVSDSKVNGMPMWFYSGGNVLLRVTDKYVKSSKGIVVTIAEAVRMWSVVKRWHENPDSFEAYSEKFFTTLSNYGISRYQDDVLIAGCHAISYKEMERAAIELGIEKKEEKTAVSITA